MILGVAFVWFTTHFGGGLLRVRRSTVIMCVMESGVF